MSRGWQNFFTAQDFTFKNIYGDAGTMVANACADVANSILREELDKAPPDLTSHGYIFTPMKNGNLWVSGPDGDGMEMSKDSLDKFWKDFM